MFATIFNLVIWDQFYVHAPRNTYLHPHSSIIDQMKIFVVWRWFLQWKLSLRGFPRGDFLVPTSRMPPHGNFPLGRYRPSKSSSRGELLTEMFPLCKLSHLLLSYLCKFLTESFIVCVQLPNWREAHEEEVVKKGKKCNHKVFIFLAFVRL